MRIRTLFLYLIGDRQAILDIVSDRRALWIGALFVLSAAFARDYDGEDLVHEPWRLLIPFAASLVASFVLFIVACGKVFLRKEGRPPFFSAYRSFLTLFWMTAPLAWLYAIPYERFLSPAAATSANLYTLAVVALWRVALMVRVAHVITAQPALISLALVMACADGVALVAVSQLPTPLIAVMGGVRLTESERVVNGITSMTWCLGVCSAPVWIIGALNSLAMGKPVWQVPAAVRSSNRAVWAFAAVSVVVWFLFLPWTQREQILRTQVMQEFRAGHITEALDFMSAREESEFPPLWDPLPRAGYENEERFFQVLETILDRPTAPWVQALFANKLRGFLRYEYIWSGRDLQGPKLTTIRRFLIQLADGPDIAGEHQEEIKRRLDDKYNELSHDDRDNLQAILELARKKRE